MDTLDAIRSRRAVEHIDDDQSVAILVAIDKVRQATRPRPGQLDLSKMLINKQFSS